MGNVSTNPYTSQSISGYNASPPPDDGSESASNKVTWAFHKTKLADPLKTLAEAVNSAVSTAHSKGINTDSGVRNQISGSLGFEWATATIGTDAITPDASAVFVGTESGATSDTLQAIVTTGSYDGAYLRLRPRHATEEIVIVHATSTAATATGANIYNAGNRDITLNDPRRFVEYQRDDNVTGGWVEVPLGALPRGHIGGLVMSNGTDTDHDIDTSAGECRDSNNVVDIVLPAMTKQIDATWSAGSGAGGRASSVSLAADTWYHLFAIIVGTSMDAGFDTSATAANLIADHSAVAYRRIGSVLTDGSANIINFTQTNDEVLWNTPVNDYNSSNPGTAAVLRALTVPTGIQVWAIHSVELRDASQSGSDALLVTSPDQTDTAASSTVFTVVTAQPDSTVTTEFASQTLGHFRTDTSAQIRTRVNFSDADVSVSGTTFGWIDRRGRDD